MKTSSVLKWIAVLPTAFLAAFLCYWLCDKLSSWPVVIWPKKWVILLCETIIPSLLAGHGFVWIGALVAPSHKKRVAIILFVLCVINAGVFIFLPEGLFFSKETMYYMWGSQIFGAYTGIMKTEEDLSLRRR